MNDPRDEREFEAWLAGESPLSKAYRQEADEQPPAELDARVLAAAEQELKVVPLQRSRQWRRWGAAVGIAASLVLAVSLLLQTAIQPIPEEAVLFDGRVDELKELNAGAGRIEAEGDATQDVPLSAPAARSPGPKVERERLQFDLMERGAMDRPRAADQLIDVSPEEQAPPLFESPAAEGQAPQRAEGLVRERRQVSPDQSEVPEAASMQSFPRNEKVLEDPAPAALMTPAPAPTPEDVLLAAVPLIRDHQAPQAGAGSGIEEIIVTSRRRMTREEARLEREREAAAEAERKARAVMEGELARVVELYEQEQPAQAFEQLRTFREQYPEHPVSVSLREQGY